jgi:hypothetical protein
MIEIEIPDVLAHQLCLGQAGILVGRRHVRERHGFRNSLADGYGRQIRSARVPFAGALEHRDPDAAVVCVFKALDIAEPGCRRQPRVLARRRFGLIDAQLPCLVERQLDKVFELGAAERFAFRHCSHDRLRPPGRGRAAGGTLAGG